VVHGAIVVKLQYDSKRAEVYVRLQEPELQHGGEGQGLADSWVLIFIRVTSNSTAHHMGMRATVAHCLH
jgi:hypothetical protein